MDREIDGQRGEDRIESQLGGRKNVSVIKLRSLSVRTESAHRTTVAEMNTHDDLQAPTI
jgi:hypothetical protein